MMALLRKTKIEPIPHRFLSISQVNEAFHDLETGAVSGRTILKHDWPEAKI
jgi:D-arabinose 1-dehydrogenase-like Zn-dependent alcohol dehydrogenase